MRCRVVGDLGQVEAVDGVVNATIDDDLVTIYGNFSVIGRSVVVSILRICSTLRVNCLHTHNTVTALFPSINTNRKSTTRFPMSLR